MSEQDVLFDYAVGTVQEYMHGYTPPGDDGRQRFYRSITNLNDGVLLRAEMHDPASFDNPIIGLFKVTVTVEQVPGG